MVGGKQALILSRTRGGQGYRGLPVKHFRKGELGQDLAEFAILLPVLFILIFGALDLGRMFFATISIANAAREGARYGGLNRDKISLVPHTCDAPTTSIAIATCRETQNSLLKPANMTVSPACPAGCTPYNPIVVTVAYDFDLLIGSMINANGIRLVRSAEMMIQ